MLQIRVVYGRDALPSENTFITFANALAAFSPPFIWTAQSEQLKKNSLQGAFQSLSDQKGFLTAYEAKCVTKRKSVIEMPPHQKNNRM